jgi:hypothetical protein
MGVGIKATYTVLDPIARNGLSGEELTAKCEDEIRRALEKET